MSHRWVVRILVVAVVAGGGLGAQSATADAAQDRPPAARTVKRGMVLAAGRVEPPMAGPYPVKVSRAARTGWATGLRATDVPSTRVGAGAGAGCGAGAAACTSAGCGVAQFPPSAGL